MNGGTATNPTGYNIESSAFTLNNPTRTAYDFAGWGGTELAGTENKTVTIAQGSTGARSYTAYWTPTTYSIAYNLDGGSVSGNPTTYNVETNTFTLANPTRANYNFAGWSGTGLTGTANTTVTVTKGSYGARTYTANWTPVQTVWNYEYTGAMQSFTASVTGTYKLEVWGAAGGGAQSASGGWGSGGAGGYAAGNVSLTAGSVVYIGVGGAGGHSTTMSMTFAGGWNGGGNGYGSDWAGNNRSNVGAGGGATHMGKTNTVLASTSVANLYIVAGGGGGAGSHGPSNGTGTGYAGGAGGTGGGGAYGVGSNSGGGGGYSGGTGGSGDSGARGGTSYVGGVTDGTTTAGARGGNGYARITWVSN